MKEFTRSCSHILNLICFVLHLLLFSFQRSIPLRSILHSPSGESPCRSVPSLCDSLYIIPHFLSLVKGFSKSFLKFFRRSSERLLKPFLSPIGLRPVGIFCTLIFRRLIIIPLSVPFVKRFSESFSKFFRRLSSSTSRYVFHFFTFPLASVPWPFPSPSFRALDYYTTFRLGCQAFFANFFCFLYDYLFSRKNYPHEGGELVECLQFLSARC